MALALLTVLVLAGRADGAARCAGADDPLPTTHDAAVQALPAIRETVRCLVNRERTRRGLRAFRSDDRLDDAAQMRVNDMVEMGYFAHEGSDGSDARAALAAQGYRYAVAGEDLVRGFTTAALTVRAWLTTWTHCSIMLDRRLTQGGIGVAFAPPLSAQDGRGLVLFGTLIAARPAGAHAPRGSDRARLGCPYWSVSPTDSGWVWELLSRAQSAHIRAVQRD